MSNGLIDITSAHHFTLHGCSKWYFDQFVMGPFSSRIALGAACPPWSLIGMVLLSMWKSRFDYL